MGVMTTKEQILKDQGPSLKLPSRPNPFETAGRTTTIVEDPVIANTVHSNAISRYHAAVQRSGMGLGCRNDFQNCENDDGGDIASFVAGSTTSFIGLLFPFVDFIFPEDAKRRPVVFCVDPALLSILDVIGRRVW